MSHIKYSTNLIGSAVQFLRACREELGEEMGQEKVYAMIDVFDPALRHQILMEMLMGNIGLVRVKVEDPGDYQRKKIQAIKAVRSLTKFGLKEAKEVMDEVDRVGSFQIPGNYSAVDIQAFKEILQGSGYSIA